MAYKDADKQREYSKKYQEDHKEQVKMYQKGYNNRNKEKIKARRKVYYQNNKEHWHQTAQENWQKRKIRVLSYYSQGRLLCASCGESDLQVLQIDHINGGGNIERKNLGYNNFYSWLEKQGYPEGYQVLCANCNIRAYHNKLRGGKL